MTEMGDGVQSFKGKALYMSPQVQTRTRGAVPQASMVEGAENVRVNIEEHVQTIEKEWECFLKTFTDGYKKRAEPNIPASYQLGWKIF